MVRIFGGGFKEVKESCEPDTEDLNLSMEKIETEGSPGVCLNVIYYFFAFFVLRRAIYSGV